MLLIQVWEEKLYAFRAVVHTVLLDKSVTEDVLQEAFARVLKSRKDFSDRQEAFHYLKKTVLSTTIDFYRRTIRYSSRVVSRQLSPDFSAELAQDQPDPLELLILQEQAEKQSRLNRRVQAALATLPTSQQEAIELFFNRSRSKRLKEICKESGIPYSTLRSRVTRGVNRLRLYLQDEKPPDFPGCEKVREENP